MSSLGRSELNGMVYWCISYSVVSSKTAPNSQRDHTRHAEIQLRPRYNTAWWLHQIKTFSVLLPICVGIHRWPVISPHKGQRHGALMFSLICAWINVWVDNREVGDMRRHRAHYDVTVMVNIPKILAVYIPKLAHEDEIWDVLCEFWLSISCVAENRVATMPTLLWLAAREDIMGTIFKDRKVGIMTTLGCIWLQLIVSWNSPRTVIKWTAFLLPVLCENKARN